MDLRSIVTDRRYVVFAKIARDVVELLQSKLKGIVTDGLYRYGHIKNYISRNS